MDQNTSHSDLELTLLNVKEQITRSWKIDHIQSVLRLNMAGLDSGLCFLSIKSIEFNAPKRILISE